MTFFVHLHFFYKFLFIAFFLTISTQKMQLFFRELGEKHYPKVIILHGLLGSSDNWLTLSKQLAENYHVFLLDQRNHGQSPHAQAWDYDCMVEDLKVFLEKNIAQNTKINLIGHSMGGKTAMLFAGIYPQWVEKLVVVDISPRYYPPHHQKILDAMQTLDLQNIPSRKEAESHFENAGLDAGTRQFILKNLYRNPDNVWSWRVNLPIIAQKIENVGAKLPENVCFLGKTLFIKGEKSDYIQDADLPIISHHFPQYQLHTINQAGHWTHAEKPQETLDILQKFITDVI